MKKLLRLCWPGLRFKSVPNEQFCVSSNLLIPISVVRSANKKQLAEKTKVKKLLIAVRSLWPRTNQAEITALSQHQLTTWYNYSTVACFAKIVFQSVTLSNGKNGSIPELNCSLFLTSDFLTNSQSKQTSCGFKMTCSRSQTSDYRLTSHYCFSSPNTVVHV